MQSSSGLFFVSMSACVVMNSSMGLESFDLDILDEFEQFVGKFHNVYYAHWVACDMFGELHRIIVCMRDDR